MYKRRIIATGVAVVLAGGAAAATKLTDPEIAHIA